MSYSDWNELNKTEKEGKDYRLVVLDNKSPITILAPHGGGIEPGTSEVARALSDNRFNLYLFEGIKPYGNNKLHVPSTKFNEPQCIDLISRSEIVVTIHGCTDKDGADVYVGGLSVYRLYVLLWLKQNEYNALYDERFGGNSFFNICNRYMPGVQLELTRSFRNKLLDNTKEMQRFVSGIRLVLHN